MVRRFVVGLNEEILASVFYSEETCLLFVCLFVVKNESESNFKSESYTVYGTFSSEGKKRLEETEGTSTKESVLSVTH